MTIPRTLFQDAPVGNSSCSTWISGPAGQRRRCGFPKEMRVLMHLHLGAVEHLSHLDGLIVERPIPS